MGGEQEQEQEQAEPSTVLANGLEARLRRDEDGWMLRIDEVVQSHVGEPGARLRLALQRWMQAATLATAEERGWTAPRALHLGGAAMSFPRALQHDLPDAVQAVIEPSTELVAFLTEHIPLPEGIAVRDDDGRAALAAAAPEHELVTIDVFAGGTIPAPFTTVECFEAARDALAPGGLLLVNSADGGDLAFLRSELATLRAVFGEVAIVTRGSTLVGIRHGNVLLLGSDAPLPLEAIAAVVRDDDPPAGVLGWDRLERFVAEGDHGIRRDATATDVPMPDDPNYPYDEVPSLPESLQP